MRCEEARELLPSYVDAEPHLAGALEVHLASCAACSGELATYRELRASLGALRDAGELPGAGFVERVAASVTPPSLPARVIGSWNDRRVRVAIASIGGVAVGVTAIALMWRRGRAAAALAAEAG